VRKTASKKVVKKTVKKTIKKGGDSKMAGARRRPPVRKQTRKTAKKATRKPPVRKPTRNPNHPASKNVHIVEQPGQHVGSMQPVEVHGMVKFTRGKGAVTRGDNVRAATPTEMNLMFGKGRKKRK